MNISYHHTEDIHNLTAPREVVPLVMEQIKPKSVLDVGCGTGTWLKVFEEHGIHDYLGVDGSHLDKALLKISPNHFMECDLRQSISLGRKFDLVVCLEVAEHLEEQFAEQLVQSLAIHGSAILFSAAIPGQGGQHHVNEQWPAYWEEKFRKHDLFFHDSIRPLIWNSEKVDWWYRQNIFLITKEKSNDPNGMRSLVHPELLRHTLSKHAHDDESLKSGKQGLRVSSGIFFSALIYKFRSLFGLR